MTRRGTGWVLAGAAVVCLLIAGVGAGAADAAVGGPEEASANATGSGETLEGATLSGIVTNDTASSIAGAVVWTESFTLPREESRTTDVTRADQTRFTVSPTGSVDDAADTFTVARQKWDGSAWVDATEVTLTRSALRNYTFEDFPEVDVDLPAGTGFTLVTETASDGRYTLDTVPAVPSATENGSVAYSVRARATSGALRNVSGDAPAVVSSADDDDANVLLVPGCELSGIAASYDADGDCSVSLTELGQASTDFANGDITLTELGQVSTAYANTGS